MEIDMIYEYLIHTHLYLLFNIFIHYSKKYIIQLIRKI